MSDFGDDEYYYEDDDGYFYVEDAYNVADELAEHAIASPMANWADEEGDPDWDHYAYFNDVEYNSDGFHDDFTKPAHTRRKPTASTKTTGRKRRAQNDTELDGGAKRQKLSGRSRQHRSAGQDIHDETIVWISRTVRQSEPELDILSTPRKNPFALLPDWKALRPANLNSLPSLPNTTPSKGSKKKKRPPRKLPIVEDDNNDEGMNGEEGPDMSALHAVIQQHLANLPAGMDQEMLMQLATQMLSGGGDADGLLDTMTRTILDNATADDDEEGQAGGVGKWLSEHGVSLEDGEEGEEGGDSEAMSETPTKGGRKLGKGSVRPITPPASSAGSQGGKRGGNS